MIKPMTRYVFILMNGEQDGLLEQIQSLGLMDITRSVKPVDATSAALYAEAQRLHALADGIKNVPVPEETAAAPVDHPVEEADRILQQLAALKEKRKILEKNRAEQLPWGAFDAGKLRALADAGVPLHFHVSRTKAFRPEWAEGHALHVVSVQNGKTYYVVAGPDGLPDEVRAPAADVAETEAEIDLLQQQADRENALALGVRNRIGELEAAEKKVLSDLDLYLARSAAANAVEDRIVTLTGFAPTDRDAEVSAALDATGVFYLQTPATVEDNPPIKLKNNRFVKMFEVLTDMYGRPAYNEFDPTPFLSVFFLLFFAMCMGDAGYGLVLFIGGLLLKKVKGLADLAPLVSTLGAGTFVVGIVMHTFFGVDISQLSWIPAWLKSVMVTGTIAGFEAQMVLALAIGVVHLCLAMVVKTVYATRNRGFLGSLGVWGWTLLIVGGVIIAALAVFSLLPAAAVKWIVIGLGILSGLGIFLFNDIHRNPLKNIGSGLWETYNTVTGLLADVLSYLRLYALGLAGGMLGKAFNEIAGIALGDGGFGWIPFLLILLAGHALNLAMCCLGAFVHPLRLNFLEFFKNSGYAGSGRTYHPLQDAKE